MTAPQFGPRLTRGGVTFSLWAPAARTVEVLLDDGAHPLDGETEGWFSKEIAGAGPGTRYRFRIDGRLDVPDPASRFQPDDVFGASEVIDPAAYRWRADDWRGRPWQDTVLVESHVGTFSPQGSYRGMIDRLDHLVDTGITALELMPVADFAGRRNWGYDGVLWYAPDSAYGRPDDLKALVDEAHLRGLMVFLDVVYNHFGPEGNYLGIYAPQFFLKADAPHSQTPWGSAIDYRVPQVRDFVIGNVLQWLRDYRFDGLRFDAVHAIPEQGEVPILHDISRAAGELAAESGRHIHLVLENDDNIAALLDPERDPPDGRYRAQWNDDYHHAWHVALTGESQGYYRDYGDARGHVARALGSGFAYQGEASRHRGGNRRGEPSGKLPPTAFVNFIQNHDQIGNRPLGDRLETLAEPHAIAAALAITLIAPMIPMLFMGEEWGAKTPFPFFCDFQGDLAHAVRAGRRKEFADAYAKYGDEIPDPLTEDTFRSAHLDWSDRDTPEGRKRLALVRDLLAVRRREIAPRLKGSRFGAAHIDDRGLLSANWAMGDGASLRLLANLSGNALPRLQQEPAGRALWGDDTQSALRPWEVRWRIGAA